MKLKMKKNVFPVKGQKIKYLVFYFLLTSFIFILKTKLADLIKKMNQYVLWLFVVLFWATQSNLTVSVHLNVS